MNPIEIDTAQWIKVYDFDRPRVSEELALRVEQQLDPSRSTQGLSYNLKAEITQGYLNIDHSDPGVSEFFDFLRESLADWVTSVLKGSTPFEFNYPSMWGVRYTKGDSAESHLHGPTCCSFSFYARADDNSSGLRFDELDLEVSTKTGTLILFPGWLWHSVPEYQPKDPKNYRVVIAGNITVI